MVDSYVLVNYTNFAMDELSMLLKKDPERRHPQLMLRDLQTRFPKIWKEYQQPKKNLLETPVKPPNLTLLFASPVAHWDLAQEFIQFNEDFYTETKIAYQTFRDTYDDELLSSITDRKPTDSEINHAFYRWQMSVLSKTGDYYEGYRKLPLFRKLIQNFQECAAAFLMTLGYSEADARNKAFHNTIFWASVHTGKSVHEPHNTRDSLIGGVYYVSIPARSGRLAIHDPRGRSPVYPIRDQGLPEPPFHRVMSIAPREGLLVLFPGWLIHSVEKSKGPQVLSKYRVSISVNLKGEWQDTAHMMFQV